MHRKTKIGTGTRDSDTTFKVKRSKVKVTGKAGHIVATSRTACLKYNKDIRVFLAVQWRPISRDGLQHSQFWGSFSRC